MPSQLSCDLLRCPGHRDAGIPEDAEDAENAENAEDAEDAEAPEDAEDAEAPEGEPTGLPRCHEGHQLGRTRYAHELNRFCRF